MRSRVLLGFVLAGIVVSAQSSTSPLVERVNDTGFIQLEAESFSQLTPSQQAIAYWLTQAAIAIDPIIYDQLSAYGVREKRLLEGILGHSSGIGAEPLAKIRSYGLLFFANRGNHNENTSQKFLPAFTFDELQDAALKAQASGAFKAYADLPSLADAAAVRKELSDIRASIFDASFETTITAKTPPPGKDIIQASSNTFYRGVTLDELKSFKEQYPLNSRVVKGADGRIREEVYRAGTKDGRVAPGLYAVYLRKAVDSLEKARAVAATVDPAQAKVISGLIRYYETGEPAEWLQFGGDWVRNNATVDFANGFIEVYRDARGAKGSSQAFVTITDKPVTDAMTKLAQNAAYFEQRAPWDAKYKRQDFTPPLVKAVQVLVETGDFHVSTIGDNLPNENQIHEMYGTKNFLFLGSSHALSGASAGLVKEFALPEEASRAEQYGREADDMLVAMHEVIGHGSGKLGERIAKEGAGPSLKEYFSTLEEARADLTAMWNVTDPKLKELGLVSNQDAVMKAMYDAQTRVALTQLRRVTRGDTLEEDHMRGRQLVALFIKDKTGAIEVVQRGGKTYYQVKDYAKMREGVGLLLAELMRIKAEGDYAAIKALIDRYGVHIDTKLRDEVVPRFRALNLPTFWGGVNVELTAELDAKGNATKVKAAYPRDPLKQYLSYGRVYER
jgi:dipeptidyl-peptidase-3